MMVMTLIVVPAQKVNASSDMYTMTVGNTNYGTYSIFDNTSDASNYVMNSMIARNNEFSFYYSGEVTGNLGDFCKSLIVKATEHNGIANAGDYLKMAYSSYQVSYVTFKNAYVDSNNIHKNLYRITYDFNYYTNDFEESLVNTRIDSLISFFDISNASDYEKTVAIYNWISSNITYDFSAVDGSTASTKAFTAYSAVNDGLAVCQGISTLMYRMLLSVGVDNRICANATHCWNIVNIDGIYYYCDPTWDLGNDDYSFFLRGTASDFETEHNIFDKSTNLGYSISNSNYVNVSESSVSGFVARLYTVAMGREADLSGLAYWTEELEANRADGAQVARMFINSTEFVNKKLDNTSYLSVLYSVFFDREMDNGGKEYWLSEMKSGKSRADVLEGFIGSQEWVNICKSYGIASGSADMVSVEASGVEGFVNRLYVNALNRNADQGGIDYWSSALSSKTVTGTEAAYSFVFSPEFVNSNVSNGEFINRLYNLFMGRAADEGGYNYWMSLMDNGSTRNDVFDGFATSAEFGNICTSYGINR